MRQQGQIKDWNDEKGFGFVEPLSRGGEQAFVHINAFLNRERRPVNGDRVNYEAMQDFQKRWQAQVVRYEDESEAEELVPRAEISAAPGRAPTRSALPILRVVLVLLVLGIAGLLGYEFQA